MTGDLLTGKVVLAVAKSTNSKIWIFTEKNNLIHLHPKTSCAKSTLWFCTFEAVWNTSAPLEWRHLTFRTQSEDWTGFSDVLVPGHTADVDLWTWSRPKEHSIAFRGEVLRWIQTVLQLATAQSLWDVVVTLTSERHVVPLKDLGFWEPGQGGRWEQLCGDIWNHRKSSVIIRWRCGDGAEVSDRLFL